MTLTIIIIVYLIGCVLAYSRLRALNVTYGNPINEGWGFTFGSWPFVTLSICANKWRPFLQFRNPDKLAAKREAKKLRQEEIQRRIAANSFDFDVRPIPEMYSWMK